MRAAVPLPMTGQPNRPDGRHDSRENRDHDERKLSREEITTLELCDVADIDDQLLGGAR